MSTNDGGPAFPNRGGNTLSHPSYDGMSLRDWFAGQALAGWISALDSRDVPDPGSEPGILAEHQAAVARLCVGYADAMLAAREAK